MSGNSNKIIAFNYFGGKFTFLDELYSHFPPEFIHLVDVFSGSMVVSLNYKGRVLKTANDKYDKVVNFFRVLRDHEAELIRALELTPCAKSEYNQAWEQSGDPIEDARRFYVRVRQSFFGLGIQQQNKGWHMARTQVNSQGGETVSRFKNGVRALHQVATEIRNNIQITNMDFREAIEKLDFDGAFFYCDPPYPLQSRASSNDYSHEFTDDDHRELGEMLHNIKGMAMVSGYDCPLMEEIYGDWRKEPLTFKLNNIRSTMRKGQAENGKPENQEHVWMNYPAPQRTLFD